MELYQLYTRVWEEEAVPLKWNESRVLLLHKGGNKSKQLYKIIDQFYLETHLGKLFGYIVNEKIERVPK